MHAVNVNYPTANDFSGLIRESGIQFKLLVLAKLWFGVFKEYVVNKMTLLIMKRNIRCCSEYDV